jgi:glucodextranase-like protein
MARSNYEIEWQTISVRTIKIVIVLFLAAIVGSIYWFWLRNPVDSNQNDTPTLAESTARFIDYEGKVEVKPKDEFVWNPASFKMDLQVGDRIRTAPDSLAKIKFEDGTEITVQSDSIVVISKQMGASHKEESPLMVIEVGESDVNAERSASAPSLSTSKISRFKLAPGSTGSVRADDQTGEHSGTINKGFGEVTTSRGETTQLSELEQIKVDKDFVTSKVKLPYTPPLVSPQNGQIFDFLTDQGLTIELKWRDVSNAARYHVQISEHPLFGKLSAENAALTKSAISIKIPKSNKKQYFWRVRSIDKAGNKSPWSDSHQFVVQSPVTSQAVRSMDKQPPALRITYMHPFFPFVQVEGTTEPDAFLTLNGEIIDVKEDGSFVYTYNLQKTGENNLVFVAEDPAGNKNTVSKKVDYQ